MAVYGMSREKFKGESPYPTSEMVSYKDFQRAGNKKDSVAIKYMNEKDELKKKLIAKEYIEAFDNWIKEAKKLI